MVLIQLLAAGEGAPWDQLMHVGITGIVGDVLAFQSRPRRAGDNFARLRLNIAKADLLILFIERQMGMIAAGKLSQRLRLSPPRPLVSGARLRITSEASMALSIRGRPLAGPSA